jgi:hypothetical protein
MLINSNFKGFPIRINAFPKKDINAISYFNPGINQSVDLLTDSLYLSKPSTKYVNKLAIFSAIRYLYDQRDFLSKGEDEVVKYLDSERRKIISVVRPPGEFYENIILNCGLEDFVKKPEYDKASYNFDMSVLETRELIAKSSLELSGMISSLVKP